MTTLPRRVPRAATPVVLAVTALLLVTGPLSVAAQAPVKADLFYLFAKVPPLPANAQQAHAGFETRFTDIERDLNRERLRITAGGSTGTASMEQFARQAESMSESQRMAMAMQMAQRQMGGTPGQDPPAVMEAMMAYGELTGRLGGDQPGEIEYLRYWDERLTNLARKFVQLDEAMRASNNFLEMSASAVRAIELDNWAKKESLLAALLNAARNDLSKRTAFVKDRIAPFNDALRKAGWGAGAASPTVVMSLGQGQLQVIGAADELVTFSRAHWKVAKELWDERLRILGTTRP